MRASVDVADCGRCLNRVCALAPLRLRASRQAFCAYERGDRLPTPDERIVRLRVVHLGLIALAAGLPDGRRQLIELETPGEVVCAGSDSGVAIWIEALASSLVCEVDFPLAEAREGAFLQALFGLTHGKLAVQTSRMVALGRLDGAERVCGFLAEMTMRIGLRRQNGWHLTLPMSREDIADYLGLNAETVSRLLGRLKKAGLVRFVTPTELLVPDIAKLSERSGGLAGLTARPRAELQEGFTG